MSDRRIPLSLLLTAEPIFIWFGDGHPIFLCTIVKAIESIATKKKKKIQKGGKEERRKEGGRADQKFQSNNEEMISPSGKKIETSLPIVNVQGMAIGTA